MEDKEQQEWDKAYDELCAHEAAVGESNKNLIIRLGIPQKGIEELTQDCSVSHYEKMELVSEPKGIDQKETSNYFESVYVDQWGVGLAGDGFEGYIYAKVEGGQWLKIRYSI